jgi:hypothetical protein
MQLDLKAEREPRIILESLTGSCLMAPKLSPVFRAGSVSPKPSNTGPTDPFLSQREQIKPLQRETGNYHFRLPGFPWVRLLTISVKEGRTLSPAAILDALSLDGIQAWEITRVKTIFPEPDSI